MIPAAPLVGAVTTRPPAAFSSLTAIAYRVTHSIARPAGSPSLRSARAAAAARRRTFRPPGRIPSWDRPRETQACMTRQMSSRPVRISSSVRQAFSFSSISAEIDRPVSRVRLSSSSPVRKGCFNTVSSSLIRSAPTASSSTTKPPPTE
ncbi:hypothetical protein QFZ82_007515 [Streptomyces sp. V4I23]|nr:hypothetical protein [Streptomyces sp. V4I23]